MVHYLASLGGTACMSSRTRPSTTTRHSRSAANMPPGSSYYKNRTDCRSHAPTCASTPSLKIRLLLALYVQTPGCPCSPLAERWERKCLGCSRVCLHDTRDSSKGKTPVTIMRRYKMTSENDNDVNGRVPVLAQVRVELLTTESAYVCAHCGRWEIEHGPRWKCCLRCQARTYCSVQVSTLVIS